MSEPAAAPGAPSTGDGAAGAGPPPAAAAGIRSSVEATTGCLARITELNQVLGAVITVSPDALGEAAARDQ